MVDGELNFITKIDRTGFDKGKKAIGNGLSSLKSSLKSLAKVAAAAFSVKMIYDFAKASKEAYNTQIEQETKLTTIMKQRMNATDDQIQSVKELAAEQQKLGVIGDEVQLAGAQQVATFLNETESINTLLPAMNNLLAQQNGLNATTSDAVNIGNMMGKVLQGQTSALKRVGISFSNAEEQVLKYGTESERAAMLAQVITNNVGHMNQALAQTDAGKQKQLANTMSDVKEQFGQAVMQIESVFLPLLSRVVSGFAQIASMAQTAASAIRSAFGVDSETNSATIAASTAATAESYEDIEESAENTQKAQENSLASFDKVIKIGKQESSGTSSGGGGTSPSATISPTKVVKASSWADELKKSLQQGDWGGLGKMLADKINSVVSKIKWKEVGEKLGQGITNAFTFAYNFLKNTKWKSIGAGFANFLNGLMKKTDFNLIGKTLGARLNAMIGLAFGFVSTFNWAAAGLGLSNIINGWFKEVDWKQLGDTLGGYLDGMITFAFNFVDNLDFETMAESFATAFNRTLAKINFKKIGQTVSKAFIGVWKFIGTALKEINWEQVGKSISEFINGIDWWGILKSLFGVIGGVLKAAPEFLLGVIKNLDFGNAAALFGLLFAPKIAKVLLNKFLGDEGVIGTLKKAGNAIGNKISTGLDGQSIGSGVGSQIASGLKTAGVLISAAVVGWQIGTKLYECMKPGIDKITDALTDALNADRYVENNDRQIQASNKELYNKLKKQGAYWLTESDIGNTRVINRAAEVLGEYEKYKKYGVTISDVLYNTSTYQKWKKSIPQLASGTVVPKNYGNFAAILGDNRKEPEVVSPLSTMKQAVLEALAMQAQQKQPAVINISLDTRNGKRLLTKEVIDDINDIIDSTGKVPINI